ncbi:MAG: molybdenum cofactor guanylyltransferase [Chloroflexota bacterium]
MELSCIVLAGGKGRRLSYDKLFLDISGRSLIERVIASLSVFKGDIIVVMDRERPLPGIVQSEIKPVTDAYPDMGPLGGIYSGLAASSSFYNLTVAGDMPFLNQSLLKYMAKSATGFDVVIPRLGEMVEPLHAVYSRACLPYIKSELEREERRIISFFPKVKVRYIEEKEIDRFDPRHLSFFNINTKDDLTTARKLVESIEVHP